MAIEDAAALAEYLDRITDATNISKGLRAFETVQKPHTPLISKYVQMDGGMWILPDGEG